MSPATAKISRTIWSTSLARWIFSVCFLFAAFSEFPDHKWSIGFAVLTFEYAIIGVVRFLQLMHAEENRIADLAERKTRHTSLLAAERAIQGRLNEWDFWVEVDERVSAELPVNEKTPGFWATTGLVAGNTAWQLAASLFGVALVAGLTP